MKGRAELTGRKFKARNARQGEIILRTRRRRVIFIAGLAGFVILVALGSFVSAD